MDQYPDLRSLARLGTLNLELEALNSSTTRPLPLRMRPDLVVRPVWHGARRYWVVKDPLAIRFYHLRDEEHALLEMLDGRHSLDEMRRQFERRFAPHRVSAEQLQAFFGMLH